jgi:hypothetical protein
VCYRTPVRVQPLLQSGLEAHHGSRPQVLPGASRFPLNVYDRAVSFSDGLLIVRKGGIRWLPLEALKEVSPAEALAFVQPHLQVRVLA